MDESRSAQTATKSTIWRQCAYILYHTAFIYLGFILIFQLQRIAFCLLYTGSLPWHQALAHALPMDRSVAGYLSIIPLIVFTLSLWRVKYTNIALKVYFALISIILSSVFILDITLYSYWGFRLDTTPVFYFTSSPSAAMASAPGEMIAFGIALILSVATAIYYLLNIISGFPGVPPDTPGKKNQPILATVLTLLLTGLLFVEIRGGVTVSTMNPGRVYFSENQTLNHAALNPAFTLLYSATHQDNFDKMYRFMPDEVAESALKRFNNLKNESDTIASPILSTSRPDIYLLILESFSNHLFKSLNGEDVASGLDSIAADGILFTDFYASGFRTDRGIPAIVSGFPSPPSTSIMKYVRKAENLPGLAEQLSSQAGYTTAYYYGGDADFANMKAFLVNQGFAKIISDKDFPVSQRLSKWGAHDDLLFNRLLADLSENKSKKNLFSAYSPRFVVVQTSSSHEPFEVPYSNRKFKDKPRRNAFAFTDSVVTDFLHKLPTVTPGRKSLVVIVSDHWGAWPEREKLPDIYSRHLIPLIITGSALISRSIRIDRPASQTDIPATLLSMLGLKHDMFTYSHDIFVDKYPYAWISDKEEIALVTPHGCVSYNIDNDASVKDKNKPNQKDTVTKAYLQNLYRTISHL